MPHRVLLYNPRAVFYTMPLGLVAVGSALDPAEYEVTIVDGRLETDPVAAVLSRLDGTIAVGMGVLTGAPIHDALRVSRAVHAARPDVPVVWGGWHPSLFPEQCLQEPSVAAVVVGQGEATFAAVLARLRGGEPLDGVAGCAHRSKGKVVVEPARAFIDVNALAPHDYGLIPVERLYALKGRRQFDYVSSQGCRFRCTFCADPFVYKRAWSGLAPARMVRELTSWHERHPFDEISFQDETFFTSRQRVDEVADAFVASGLTVPWTATLRADQGHRLPDGSWARARASGLARVMIGIEAGSQAMLDWMKKDIRIEQVYECAEQCLRHGIGAIFNLIVGFPGESPESVRETLAVAQRLRAMSPEFQAAIFYYRPYPGNEIADALVRDGHVFPETLEAWAEFDYVDSAAGSWMRHEDFLLVERFKFYQRHAFDRPRPLRWPLRKLSRWRVERDFYRFPVEKTLVEYIRPPRPLS